MDFTSSEPVVLKVDHQNHSEIILNRPNQLNSLNYPLYETAHNYFKMCESDDDKKFVVFKGTGRAFCAGGDIKFASQSAKSLPANYYPSSFALHNFLYTLATVKKPVICYMNGITAGGGAGLAQLSAFKIATEKTEMYLPECQIGHFCDASNTFTFSRLDGHLGIYLALTGHKLKAEEVLFAGLATHFVHSSNLAALDFELSQMQNVSLYNIDETISNFAVSQDHIPTRNTIVGEKLEIIKRCFKYNTVEEIIAALKEESSKFAQSCLKSMSLASPTSLKISLELLRYGANRSLSECINYEYRGWCRLPENHDYQEGVSSLLNKKIPEWVPENIEDVPDVQSNFLPPVAITLMFRPDVDYTTSPYKQFLLPDYEEVCKAEQKYHLKSNTEIVSWFVKNRKQKFGVKEKVQDILQRRQRTTKSIHFRSDRNVVVAFAKI